MPKTSLFSKLFPVVSLADSSLTTYERGLVVLTNRIAIVLILLFSLVILPLAVINHETLPVLLISAVFYPVVLFLDYKKKYRLAKHWLAVSMYGLITALIIYRGANSGVLYLIAPTLLVVLILFQHAGQALKVHIGIFIFLTGLLFIYAQVADPVKPYSPIALKFIYPFNLATSLGLLIVLARFFFKLNNEYQRELLAISDTKTRLMAVIGHDLRGPINSLLALLDLAKQKAVSPEEFERLAGRLHQNTQEVHQTLNNLLNWSLTQLEGIKAVPAKINVAHACSSVADLYQQIADKKSIKILLDIKPELYVWCDEEQIKLILRNLLSNAIKYSQENSQVVISAKKFTTKVTISIADTGIGMSQQQLASILEPSLKSSKMGTKGEAGTGLGLMLVQEMVSLNNGKLSVSSQPNQGTVFTVSLPWPKTN